MLPSILLLLFTGASAPSTEVQVPAGRGKKTYVLPDGKRVRTTREQAEALIREHYTPQREEQRKPAILRPDLPPLAGALPSIMEPLVPEVLVPQAPLQRRIQQPDMRALLERDDEDVIALLLT